MNRTCQRTPGEILLNLFHKYPALEICRESIIQAYEILKTCFEGGNKLLVCGNGGSAADAEHIVGELMKSFMFKRNIDSAFARDYEAANAEKPPPWLEGALPAVSLVSHTALSTAFGNDETSIGTFAQQVYGYGDFGDVLFAISTSGNSDNVVEAAKVAKAKKLHIVALTGERTSKLSAVAEVCVKVPESDTSAVQELHLPVYHALCAAVESAIFGGVKIREAGA